MLRREKSPFCVTYNQDGMALKWGTMAGTTCAITLIADVPAVDGQTCFFSKLYELILMAPATFESSEGDEDQEHVSLDEVI